VFVVGFSTNLATSESQALDQMAMAGGNPCTGAICQGHSYYAADSVATLDAAIMAITGTIVGEFQGGTCDDSCYSNGCPNAGEICVNSTCRPDPCANHPPCAPGDYCYTDGTSPGTCMKSCASVCPTGEICNTQGLCEPDPCATVSCPADTVCKDGNCVQDKCSVAGCEPGFVCYKGSCIDDPCRYVHCPDGHQCQTGTGACAALGNAGGPGGNRNRNSGCDVAPAASRWPALAALAAIAAAFILRRRRSRS
jgi:MYXO-CTERM domain-containing protein